MIMRFSITPDLLIHGIRIQEFVQEILDGAALHFIFILEPVHDARLMQRQGPVSLCPGRRAIDMNAVEGHVAIMTEDGFCGPDLGIGPPDILNNG